MNYEQFYNSIKSAGEIRIEHDCSDGVFKQTERLVILRGCYIKNFSLYLVLEADGEIDPGGEYNMETTGEFDVVAPAETAIAGYGNSFSAMEKLVENSSIKFSLVDVETYLKCGYINIASNFNIDEELLAQKERVRLGSNDLTATSNKQFGFSDSQTDVLNGMHINWYGYNKNVLRVSGEVINTNINPTDVIFMMDELRSLETLKSILQHNNR